MRKRNPDTDRYGDGDVPESDYEPYQDNKYDPHPQAGRNQKSPTVPFSKENKNRTSNGKLSL